jgi:hypothetical protein
MRRLLPLLILLVIFTGALVACGGTPALTVEMEQLDLGDVPNGQVVTREVAVSNTGSAPLVVDSIATSCGCTTASLVPEQLAPGESGTLEIAFDAGAHGPELTGPLVRQIFINSNDPARPEVTVELAVNVISPLAEDNN